MFAYELHYFGLSQKAVSPMGQIWSGDHSCLAFCHLPIYIGVVWHTGKVLGWGVVGPWFKPGQGQGIL